MAEHRKPDPVTGDNPPGKDALAPRTAGELETVERVTREAGTPVVSANELPERAHSASAHGGPVPAEPGVEHQGMPESDDPLDRMARDAGAMGQQTVTDPLLLVELEDRYGRRPKRSH